MTHPGHCRKRNEDTYYGNLNSGLWLIADGMGGHGRGEQASAMSRDTIVADVSAGQSLEQAMRHADQAIVLARGASNQIMGSSVVALQIQHQQFEIALIGDTRAYLVSDHLPGSVRAHHATILNTIDHNLIAAASHHKTHALGITDPEKMTISRITGFVSPGMQWLLCSDGIGDYVDRYTLKQITQQTDVSAQECVDFLVATALDNGGTDNLTLLLIRAR